MRQEKIGHGEIEYRNESLDDPSTVKSQIAVTSVRVLQLDPEHEKVRIYNRGALAGSIFVQVGDGEVIARRLIDGGNHKTQG